MPPASPTPPIPSVSPGVQLFEHVPSPTISGRTVVGQTLTAESGAWRPAGARFSYQWLRDGEPIEGADQQTLRLAAADFERRISVRITGELEGFATTRKASLQTERIAAGTLTDTPTPTISGSAAFGNTLTANPGQWGPGNVEFAYQWLRDGGDIRGATQSTYRLTNEDIGAIMKVRVRGTRTGFEPVTRNSAASNQVRAASLTDTPTPRIRGDATYNEWLTADSGTWGPGAVNLSYQWHRDGTAISGATGNRYQVHVADIGTNLTVRVTGRRVGFETTAVTSQPVTPVGAPLSPTPTPTISGKPVFSQTLTADAGKWGPSGVSLSYQWYRDGAAIKGATSRELTLTPDDVGARIKVRVTGEKLGHATTRKHSSETDPVAAAHLSPTPKPTLSGYPLVKQKLTATAGAWGPGEVTLSYQWHRQKKDAAAAKIPKANASTYLVTDADVDYQLKVQVTGKKPGYQTKSVYSELSKPVTLK